MKYSDALKSNLYMVNVLQTKFMQETQNLILNNLINVT